MSRKRNAKREKRIAQISAYLDTLPANFQIDPKTTVTANKTRIKDAQRSIRISRRNNGSKRH